MVDTFTVKVTYSVTTTTTGTRTLSGPGAACLNGSAGCYQDTGGQVLNPRGFWATMNTAGAANVNGDAYQPYYDVAGSTPAQTCPSAGNACYDPVNYYNYAVYMPPNTSGGYVYVYDPVFCATALASGTGDRWFGSSNPVSSWYELFADPNNTPYDITDDTLVATSGSKFQDIAASDTSMGGSGGSQCRQTNVPYGDGRDYHDSWYLLNPGNPLTGDADGTTYRIHTTSSVPTGQTDSVNQRSTDGEQSFAIFANNAEGTTTNGRLPQVYGLGAMQMFTPLSASGSTTNSEFYLAQVPAYLRRQDPGDQALGPRRHIPTVGDPVHRGADLLRLADDAVHLFGDRRHEQRQRQLDVHVPVEQLAQQQLGPDIHGRLARPVQWLLADARDPDPDQLRGRPERLVEDPVLDERERDVQRRHDLDRLDQGQPGPPRRAVAGRAGPATGPWSGRRDRAWPVLRPGASPPASTSRRRPAARAPRPRPSGR